MMRSRSSAPVVSYPRTTDDSLSGWRLAMRDIVRLVLLRYGDRTLQDAPLTWLSGPHDDGFDVVCSTTDAALSCIKAQDWSEFCARMFAELAGLRQYFATDSIVDPHGYITCSLSAVMAEVDRISVLAFPQAQVAIDGLEGGPSGLMPGQFWDVVHRLIEGKTMR